EDVLHLGVDGVVALDAREVDAVEAAEAEEEFLLQGARREEGFELLAGGAAALDEGDVTVGLVDVGPARDAVEGVGAGAEAEVGLASPVFQIMLGMAAGQAPAGNFIVIVAGFGEFGGGVIVEVGHGVIVGERIGAIAAAAGKDFP